MATLTNSIKQKLEHLFRMQTGYVLDFSDASFHDFIQTSVGIDTASDRASGESKAWRLRRFWQKEDNQIVAKLTLDMLERWQASKLMANEPITKNEQLLYDQCVEAMQQISNVAAPTPSETELAFLEKDLGAIDISKLKVSISLRDVIRQRLDEIQLCTEAKAPLAVVFLCGSTLEGLLYELAQGNPRDFNMCASAPRQNGKVKPLAEWTLENLIVTSRELGIVGEDVVKHAHAVKDFRNYIHPKQQVKENFKPRMFTAEIASKVLYAAIADLGAI